MVSTRCVLGIAILSLCLSHTLADLGGNKVGNSSHSNDTTSNNETKKHEKVNSFHVAKFDFKRIKTPFTIAIWVLLASLAKLGFHLSSKLSSIVPESCLVILLGVVVGGILYAIDMQDVPLFDANVFFIFLLPPIVLEAGYFLQNREFFDNIGTILLYAVVGTLFNAFTVGLSLYGVSGKLGIDIPLMDALLFGTLIAAVDPVAVLAVFEEIHVNVMLYILVFGESLLNDAVTVVLYNMFKSFSLLPEVTAKEIALGVVSFFLVSLGGTFIGILWGFATAFVTRFTDHVRVIEPIFVFVMSYSAYLSAELFHFSGIMSIVSCAIVMKPYVEGNISRKSHTTVKYFMKMMSSCSETVIFMLLGASLVTRNIHSWDTNFILLTIIFISVYRTIGVVILTFLANHLGRLNKLSLVDQFIMSYGGIRGAVSFSLALILTKDHFKQYNLIFTTTITVVMFTVFVQGTTIKPLVKILHVRLKGKEKPLMVTQLSDKLLDHIVAGIEEISGHRGHGYWREWLHYIHSRYLTRWLMRDGHSGRDDILLAYRKMAYRDALTHLEREGSGAALFTPSASGHHLDLLAASSLEAGAICAREPEEDESGEELEEREGDRESTTSSDPCRHVRFPDDALVDWRANEQAPDDSTAQIQLRDHHNLDSLIAAAPKHYHHRTFNRNNLMEDDDWMAARLFPVHHASLVNAPRLHHRKPHRKHRRHHRKRDDRTDGSLPVKQLSTIFEPDEDVEVERDHKAPQVTGHEDSEDVGITFKASPLAHGELPREPSRDKDRKDGDHHRHKHHGRHHERHHDKGHEESEVPERLDRRMGRLPSFDEDGVVPDSRARDSRDNYPDDGDIRAPPEINKDDPDGQGGEKGPETQAAAVKIDESAEEEPAAKSELEDNKTGKEKSEEDGKSESEHKTAGTVAAGSDDDKDEEEQSPTTGLLDSYVPEP